MSEEPAAQAHDFSIGGDVVLQYLAGELSFDKFNALLQNEVEHELEDIVIEDDLGVASVTEVAPEGGAGPREEVEENWQEEDEEEDWKSSASVEKAGSEQGSASTSPRKKGISKLPKKKSTLPRHLEGLLGEANIRFARGEIDDAAKICLELIRIVPKASEVYNLLGMLYENQGDKEKAFQFHLIAAHLGYRNADQWVSLAHTAKDLKQPDTAIACLNRAIKLRPGDLDLLQGRVELHESKGDRVKAIECLEVMLKHIRNGTHYFELARQIVKEHHENGESGRALKVLEGAFHGFPGCQTLPDINNYLELLMLQRRFISCIWVMMCFCDIQLEEGGQRVSSSPEAYKNEAPSITNPTKCTVPSGLPIDLCVKLLMCIIYLGFNQCVEELLSILLLESAEESGDLYLDVAEAFMEKGHLDTARSILRTLVETENYALAAVWLKYAECLQSLGELTEAALAYTNVVTLAPGHVGARVALSMLHQQLGRPELALGVLSQAPDDLGTSPDEPVDLELALPRCFLLHSHQWWRPFIKAARALLFGQFPGILQPKALQALVHSETAKIRMENLKALVGPELFSEIKTAQTALSQHSTIIKENLWDLMIKLCGCLLYEGLYTELFRVAVAGVSHPVMEDSESRCQYLQLITVQACLYDGQHENMFYFTRMMCLKHLYNKQAWNLFALNTTYRHDRFCLRLMFKYPDHPALALMNGHNALKMGSYKHALAEYFSAFRCQPNDPFRSLCIGVTFMHLACQKFVVNRHSLMMQASAFLTQYQELRGEGQETLYNLGRYLHQLGLYHAATHYYHEALKQPPVSTIAGEYDLTYEIAFNLCLVYRASGSHLMVRMIMDKYMTI